MDGNERRENWIWCFCRCIYVMDLPALQMQRAVKAFATWQHRFDVDSNYLSYPALLPVVQCRPFSSSVDGSDYLPQSSTAFVQYTCEAREMPTLAQYIGTTDFTARCVRRAGESNTHKQRRRHHNDGAVLHFSVFFHSCPCFIHSLSSPFFHVPSCLL